MQPVAVFHDPTNRPDYVRRYAQVLQRCWGIGVVLLYPAGVSRLLVAQADAVIGAVAARYSGDLSQTDTIADVLSRHFHVVAAIPQAENQVLPSAQLADRLGVGRIPYETIRRFRDKYSLKAYLRGMPGSLRVNRSCRVDTTEQALRYVEEQGLERFVLKPNDGSGNSRIAFFDGQGEASAVGEYFAQNDGDSIVPEEYIGGAEYTVNGQIDPAGRVRTFSVQSSNYVAANGRTNLGAATGWSRTAARSSRRHRHTPLLF